MLTPSDRHAPPATSLVLVLPAPPRLDVIEALLSNLETATTAGQHYLMGKVLTQLREAAVARQNLSPHQRRMVRNMLAVLAHESERLMPNADPFVRSARALTDVLSPV
jgi:hypothetical protein